MNYGAPMKNRIKPCSSNVKDHSETGTILIEEEGSIIAAFGEFLNGTPLFLLPLLR